MRRQPAALAAAVLVGLVVLAVNSASLLHAAPPETDSPEMVALGKAVFFDENLRRTAPSRAPLATRRRSAFTGPDSGVNATTGAPACASQPLWQPQTADGGLRRRHAHPLL